MKEEFKLVQYDRKAGQKYNLDFLGLESAKEVHHFHASFPVYKETPLAELKETAKDMGLADIYVKDESYRFGLNAFKVLDVYKRQVAAPFAVNQDVVLLALDVGDLTGIQLKLAAIHFQGEIGFALLFLDQPRGLVHNL